MKLKKREHDEIHGRVTAQHKGAKLHTHGTWTRRVRIGAQEHAKPEYLHVYKTDDPDRFLVHLLDGNHLSYETKASVDEMLEDFEAGT